MTTHMVTVRDTATAAQALEEIRRQAEEVEDFYQVFVVDGDRRLVGAAVQGSGHQPAGAAGAGVHGRRPTSSCAPDADQEEVARLHGALQPAQRRRWWTRPGGCSAG